jgi:YHS domain-containing protein
VLQRQAKAASGKSCCADKKEGDSCCSGKAEAAGKKSCCCDDKNAKPTAQVAADEKLICPVSGEELKVESAVRVVYNGKVYYVGCENCKAQFLKDPATYAKKAESLSKLQGKPEQPAPKETTAAPADKLICPVSAEEIEESSAVRFTYNGKVYYTCCNSCKSKFLKDPETYAKKAESISQLQGRPEADMQ